MCGSEVPGPGVDSRRLKHSSWNFSDCWFLPFSKSRISFWLETLLDLSVYSFWFYSDNLSPFYWSVLSCLLLSNTLQYLPIFLRPRFYFSIKIYSRSENSSLSKATPTDNTNRLLCVVLLNIFGFNEFKSTWSSSNLDFNDFLSLLATTSIAAAIKIPSVPGQTFGLRLEGALFFPFGFDENGFLRESDT